MATRIADLPLLSRLFDLALALDPAQLEPWLDALPEEQRHLRSALSDMLAKHHAAGPADFLASGPVLDDAWLDETTPRPDDRVGPYRLIREIGRGGMGAVWLAERADGTLQREVALKLPRLVWGANLARRMARERDIGARLAHPNIARLYDAGVDELGRPYLALEYIDGQPLSAWRDTQAPSLAQRLHLFVQIVRAVAYAHGRLVVHRDLKPSNVLVSADGQSHLLDFGIARLLHEAAESDDEPLTQEQTRMLTPHYASPEQLRGEPVTVASDIYSLGVLLFELLTGRRPHEAGTQGLAALEAAVLRGEPPLASRSAADPHFARALQGDVDAIIGKALKRHPGERYATADALADDIERHLAGTPVRARPDRLGYRAAKLLRRHRLAFGAAGAVVFALLGGAGIAAVQAGRASDAAARARVVKEFVIEVFKVGERGNPANAQLRQLPVELLVERSARLIESRFAGQLPLQAELYGVVAGILADMGASELAATYAQRQLQAQERIDASPTERSQASLLLAQALLAQGRLGDALPQAQRALAQASGDPALKLKAQVLLARVQLRQGQGEQAAATLAEAEQALKRTPGASTEAALVQGQRATLLVRANRFDEALPLYLSAIDNALSAEGPLSPTAIDLRLMLATNLMLQERPDESRVQRESAMAALRASGGAGEVRAALESSNFSRQLFFNRQLGFAEAKAAIEQARDVVAARGSLVPERIKATIALDLGNVLLVWGDLQRAAPLIDASVNTLMAQVESPGERYVLADVQAIAAMYAGRHDQAESLYLAELEATRQMGTSRHPDRAFDHARRAMNRSMQRRHEDALAILASAADLEPLKGADEATVTAYREVIPRALARVLIDHGDAAAAWAALPPAAHDDPDVPYPFDELLLRGEVLCALGRGREGLPLLERSLKIHAERNYANDPAMARARATTGLCALASGQRQRAAELAALARHALADQPDVSPYFRQASERLNALLAPAGR